MILTVTLNAALDITYRVPSLRARTAHRVAEVAERAGGKGLNVARVLAALGHRAVVAGFAGGATGEALRGLLAADGAEAFPRASRASGASPAAEASGASKAADNDAAPLLTDALTPIAGATRRTVGVVDESSGDTTQLNEPGPTITRPEWDAFLLRYRELLGGARAVALCGSLPPGLPVGTYAGLIREAQAADVPVLLDTSGEALRRGIAARPDLVKPNADELAGLTGSTEPLRAAQDTRRRGARAVAASLGADGMLLVTPDGDWQAAPPRAFAGNPTGAGDSAVAGLLSGLAEGLPWPDRLARAVALSAATVLAPVAGEFDRAAYAELLPRVEIARGAGTPEA